MSILNIYICRYYISLSLLPLKTWIWGFVSIYGDSKLLIDSISNYRVSRLTYCCSTGIEVTMNPSFYDKNENKYFRIHQYRFTVEVHQLFGSRLKVKICVMMSWNGSTITDPFLEEYNDQQWTLLRNGLSFDACFTDGKNKRLKKQ